MVRCKRSPGPSTRGRTWNASGGPDCGSMATPRSSASHTTTWSQSLLTVTTSGSTGTVTGRVGQEAIVPRARWRGDESAGRQPVGAALVHLERVELHRSGRREPRVPADLRRHRRGRRRSAPAGTSARSATGRTAAPPRHRAASRRPARTSSIAFVRWTLVTSHGCANAVPWMACGGRLMASWWVMPSCVKRPWPRRPTHGTIGNEPHSVPRSVASPVTSSSVPSTRRDPRRPPASGTMVARTGPACSSITARACWCASGGATGAGGGGQRAG